ncbi:3087_t:CDS:2, partial [Scutellospora calospora]
FGPNDLLNNDSGPNQTFSRQIEKFNELKTYTKSRNLKYQLILSVLLPVNEPDLIRFPPFSQARNGRGGDGQAYDQNDQTTRQFVNELVGVVNNYSFDGIDIDYPRKFPCFPTTINGNINLDDFFTQFLNDTLIKLKRSNKNKILTITAGQYPLNNIGDIVSFVNIQMKLAGIVDINSIIMNWINVLNKSKLVLGVDFGGIVEGFSSNNIGDIDNRVFTILNIQSSDFADEIISDSCGTFASWSWKNLSSQLLSPCYTNTTTSSEWVRVFDNKTKQPYIYKQITSQPNQYYYVSYEDFQSLSAKLVFIHNNNLSGIAISDVTKDSSNMTLTNFIASGNPNSPNNLPGNSSQTPKAENVKTTVVAMFDYMGKEENDLSFKAGDVIEVLERGEGPNDWWVGRLRGVIGEFP